MDFTLHTLHNDSLPAIVSHLKRLNKEDRYMRFCSALGDYAIEHYASTIDLKKEHGIGVFNDNQLIAFAIVCPIDDQHGQRSAEFGISIDKEYRSGGIAQAMLQASIDYCKRENIGLLFMMCLHENKKMQALAKQQGLTVIIQEEEAYAEIDL